MHNDMNEEDNIENFFQAVEKNMINGMPYRDAIEIAAVMEGGIITAKISQAMAKYQEALHPQSHLSQEKNVDDLALMSMGVLWDNEYFNPMEMDKITSSENTLAESIYFIMKYGKEEGALTKALEANSITKGDVKTRALAINRILGKV